MGACGVAVGGSCSMYMGMGIETMAKQSVICTELFRQGRMSFDSYLADAHFGERLRRKHPNVMKMYKLLARPIVRRMKESETISWVVEVLSLPWRQHMEYTEGLRDSDNLIGRTLMILVVPLFEICWAISYYFLYVQFVASVLFSLLFIRLTKLNITIKKQFLFLSIVILPIMLELILT